VSILRSSSAERTATLGAGIAHLRYSVLGLKYFRTKKLDMDLGTPRFVLTTSCSSGSILESGKEKKRGIISRIDNLESSAVEWK
jgi:hypothetical protein